jgi:hypothetical protein
MLKIINIVMDLWLGLSYSTNGKSASQRQHNEIYTRYGII